MRVDGLLGGFALGAILLASCGDDDDIGPGEADATPSASATPAQSSTPTLDTAVTALFGQWRTAISAGDNVTLSLREGVYAIGRGAATGRGRMKVSAREAEFSGSDLCDGIGIYRWSLQETPSRSRPWARMSAPAAPKCWMGSPTPGRRNSRQ